MKSAVNGVGVGGVRLLFSSGPNFGIAVKARKHSSQLPPTPLRVCERARVCVCAWACACVFVSVCVCVVARVRARVWCLLVWVRMWK